MKDEYEYLTADCAGNLGMIANWVFSGKAFVKSNIDDCYSVDPVNWVEIGRTYRRKKPAQDVLLTDVDDISRGIIARVVEFRYPKSKDKKNWSIAGAFGEELIRINLKGGIQYRIKPGHALPPKKVNKLVDRTEEEIIPLIGRYIVRKKDDGLYFMITSNQVFGQENMEIAPLGSEEWCPMQKTVECDA